MTFVRFYTPRNEVLIEKADIDHVLSVHKTRTAVFMKHGTVHHVSASIEQMQEILNEEKTKPDLCIG